MESEFNQSKDRKIRKNSKRHYLRAGVDKYKRGTNHRTKKRFHSSVLKRSGGQALKDIEDLVDVDLKTKTGGRVRKFGGILNVDQYYAPSKSNDEERSHGPSIEQQRENGGNEDDLDETDAGFIKSPFRRGEPEADNEVQAEGDVDAEEHSVPTSFWHKIKTFAGKQTPIMCKLYVKHESTIEKLVGTYLNVPGITAHKAITKYCEKWLNRVGDESLDTEKNASPGKVNKLFGWLNKKLKNFAGVEGEQKDDNSAAADDTPEHFFFYPSKLNLVLFPPSEADVEEVLETLPDGTEPEPEPDPVTVPSDLRKRFETASESPFILSLNGPSWKAKRNCIDYNDCPDEVPTISAEDAIKQLNNLAVHMGKYDSSAVHTMNPPALPTISSGSVQAGACTDDPKDGKSNPAQDDDSMKPPKINYDDIDKMMNSNSRDLPYKPIGFALPTTSTADETPIEYAENHTVQILSILCGFLVFILIFFCFFFMYKKVKGQNKYDVGSESGSHKSKRTMRSRRDSMRYLDVTLEDEGSDFSDYSREPTVLTGSGVKKSRQESFKDDYRSKKLTVSKKSKKSSNGPFSKSDKDDCVLIDVGPKMKSSGAWANPP